MTCVVSDAWPFYAKPDTETTDMLAPAKSCLFIYLLNLQVVRHKVIIMYKSTGLDQLKI